MQEIETIKTTVLLDERIHRWLRMEAARLGLSISIVIEMCVNTYRQDHPDVARWEASEEPESDD